MTVDDGSFFDGLSAIEGEYCQELMDRLKDETWAIPLLTQIADAGGIKRENKALLFELRFASALHEQGITPDYEIPGEGGSTIDFGFFCGGTSWAVELMRLEETDAARAATRPANDPETGEFVIRHLSTNADDPRQSTEGETLKAIQRLCQKCEKDGRPHKFPLPNDSIHVLAIDFRTFLNGGDAADKVHVGLGAKYVKPAYRLSWDGKLITGVFDPDTTLRGAKEVQERVHFLAFAEEKEFGPGKFGPAISFIANPNLFGSEDEVRKAIEASPFQPALILNVGSS